MALNNNEITNILKSTYSQVTGNANISEVDLRNIIDTGNETLFEKEQFTKALVSQITKTIFTDEKYESDYTDPFYVDSTEYGAIIQAVSAEAPEVQESHAWQTFTSGVSKVGQYTVYLPILDTQYFGKTVSWELPITITYEQWNDAVHNYEELRKLTAYIFVVVENAITLHRKDMNSANRNNFIAEKIAYSKKPTSKGIHTVNLVKEYCDFIGATEMTVDNFMKNPDALRYASGVISEYFSYIGEQTSLFNTANKVRFVPKKRRVFQLLEKFAKAMEVVSYSSTFNEEYVKLPTFEKVAFWQGTGEGLTFDEVSKIQVLTSSDGTSITQTGVVGLLCDKLAVAHTIRSERVAVKNFDPEGLDMYFYQYRDSYFNNLTLNGIVFIVENVTATV